MRYWIDGKTKVMSFYILWFQKQWQTDCGPEPVHWALARCVNILHKIFLVLLSNNYLKTLYLQSFESITVLFCELCDFDYSTIEGAMDIVLSMNAVFSCFDTLMDQFNVYKVKLFILLKMLYSILISLEIIWNLFDMTVKRFNQKHLLLRHYTELWKLIWTILKRIISLKN